jgi:uncharacterized membrane protein
MSLTPFSEAPALLQLHVLLALSAIALTLVIFSLPKGSRLHRQMGRVWVGIMAGIAISSFWIHELRLIGSFSPIHFLSLYVLWNLVAAVRAARSGRIAEHRRTMQSLAFGALLLAGAFTFLPGRVMHQIFLGG